MRNTSILCAVGGAVCLLLAGFLVGRAEQGKPSKSAAPASTKSSAPSALTEPAAKPAVAADPAGHKKSKPASAHNISTAITSTPPSRSTATPPPASAQGRR